MDDKYSRNRGTRGFSTYRTVAHKGHYALPHSIFRIIKYAFHIMHNTFQIPRNTFQILRNTF